MSIKINRRNYINLNSGTYFFKVLTMKDLLLGLLIGGIVGLWIGVNLGKDQPLMTNPFVEKNNMKELGRKMEQLQKDVSKKSEEIYKETKQAVGDAFE